MTGRDEFIGSRTGTPPTGPGDRLTRGRVPALEAALAEARDLPDGPARQVALERLAERADLGLAGRDRGGQWAVADVDHRRGGHAGDRCAAGELEGGRGAGRERG
ncbi:hypothetical protein [Micromonospora foliorum]|uniref:hypothetical protein n=1 Tax=Micromonospora foliorum TaxID=2911210 RepID=UPI001EE7F96F|nr:hypothetical protein [Micromonospora foliorum]MCG5437418.1 hypothetical protein [Micromonospora foliorum]